jgi:hypothetical protein
MRVAHALCDGAGATKFLTAVARFALGQGSFDLATVWHAESCGEHQEEGGQGEGEKKGRGTCPVGPY